MSLTLLVAALASTPAPPAAESASAAEARTCPNVMHHAEQNRRARYRRLDQLPPGRLELTVLRSVGGCPEPVVLREGIGAAPAPEAQPGR